MIEEKHIEAAANKLGCSPAAIRAVDLVESTGTGFYKSGKIVIKFEGHIFRAYTKGKYDQSHPDLSYRSWTEKYTEYGELSYRRFNRAFDLDPIAAMLSTSWGRFQIMGENYSECGFRSIHDFVTNMKLGDEKQLNAFCNYVLSRKLDKYLEDLSLYADHFAYRYNGPLYKKNNYGTKLRRAYAHYLTLYKTQS